MSKPQRQARKPQREVSFDSASERYAFSAIRCQTVWLSDAIEMHRDTAALRTLLQMALSATTTAEMQIPLRMAMDLLALHIAISHQLLGEDSSAYEPVLLVIEQLEATGPEDPLLVPRAADFMAHVDVLVRHAEDLIDRLGTAGPVASSVNGLDADILRRRSRILADVASLTDAYGHTRLSMTWLQ